MTKKFPHLIQMFKNRFKISDLLWPEMSYVVLKWSELPKVWFQFVKLDFWKSYKSCIEMQKMAFKGRKDKFVFLLNYGESD